MLGMLKSRKVIAAIVGLIFIIVNAALNQEQIDPNTVTNAVMGIVAALMASIAVEDGMKARADSNATTTTVTTPGGSDVTVIAPPDTAAPPAPAPFVPAQRMTAEESLRARGGPAGMV